VRIDWLIDWLLKVQQAIFQSYSGWEKLTHFTVENNQHLSFSKDWILQELDNFNTSVAIQDQLKTIESYRSININNIFDSHICHVYDNSTQNYRFNFFSHNFGKYRILGCNIWNFRQIIYVISSMIVTDP
jgi:hypothetical protein